MLVSAGFDAHRADPLTGLGLSAGDFADLTARVMALAAPRRLVVFLEGGYDLDALRDSTAATVSTLLGEPEPGRARHDGRSRAGRSCTRSATCTTRAPGHRLTVAGAADRRFTGRAQFPRPVGSSGSARVPIDNG